MIQAPSPSATPAPYLVRLAAWIRTHGHYVAIQGERIVIGIPCSEGDGSESTALEYVASYEAARTALGY